MSLLTPSQEKDLHGAIIAYLEPRVPAENLRELAGVLDVDVTSESYAQKSSTMLLEKKWLSIVRLQKKILDLEERQRQLEAQLEAQLTFAGPSASGIGSSAVDWTPSATALVLAAHRSPVTALALHPTLNLLASGSDDGILKLWDLDLPEQPVTTKRAHSKAITSLAFAAGQNPSEITLASSSSDLYINLYTTAQLELKRTLTGHEHTISEVRFTPTSPPLLISCSRDRSVKFWDLETGFCVRSIVGHSDWVRSIDPSPLPSTVPEYVLSVSSDQSARVSSFATGKGVCGLIGHSHVVEVGVFAPHSAWPYLDVVAGLSSAEEQETSGKTTTDTSAELQAGTESLLPYKYATTGGRDNTIVVWLLPPPPGYDSRATRSHREATAGGAVIVARLTAHTSWVRGLAFHPGGKYFFSCSDDRTVIVWNLTESQIRPLKVLKGHEKFVSTLAVPPVSNSLLPPTELARHIRRFIVTGSVDTTIRIWK